MWGTHSGIPDILLDHRFIPTHVGNTHCGWLLLATASVHPHACGEHGCVPHGFHLHYGSSPRMWGTRVHHPGSALCPRFIPTHVGNTYSSIVRGSMSAVHPHACGEHLEDGVSPIAGSVHPHVWGTREDQQVERYSARFIPTHVGNTATESGSVRRLPVHPHACGEHILMGIVPLSSVGSSPRMWGTQSQSYSFHHIIRFIPTHVGNT